MSGYKLSCVCKAVTSAFFRPRYNPRLNVYFGAVTFAGAIDDCGAAEADGTAAEMEAAGADCDCAGEVETVPAGRTERFSESEDVWKYIPLASCGKRTAPRFTM